MAGFYMSERFGAWQLGDDPDKGAVQFKIFFPDRNKAPDQYEARAGQPTYGNPQIASIRVVGDFMPALGLSPWDWANGPAMSKTSHARGTVWTYQTPVELPKGFYQYKYLVTFANGSSRKVPDPCTRYGGPAGQNSGVVVGGSSPASNVVPPVTGGRKHLRDLVVYELNIDDFTEQYRGSKAPLEAVRDRLDYLQNQLGVNAIEFLPWVTWSNPGYSWGYNPVQDFAVEFRYVADLDAPQEKLSLLAALITDCHQRGIHVIVDGVYNHVGGPGITADNMAFGFPYFWLYQNTQDCPYIGKFAGDFGAGLPDRDFHNGCVQEFIRDVCYYWMDKFGIDGFRLDAALYYYSAGDQRGLPQLVADIRSHAADPNFSITLEFLDMTAAGVTNQVGATSYWNNEFYGRTFDYLWNWGIDSRIVGALNTHVGLDADKVATTYLSNHDHSQVAWQAGARHNQGAMEWYRVQPYAIAQFTSPGCALLPNGEEFAEDYWVMENDEGSGRRVTPRRLRWDFQTDKIGAALGGLFKKLIKLRLTHAALRSDNFYPNNWQIWQTQPDPQGFGVDVAKGTLIYHRWGSASIGQGTEYFMIVLNFSPTDQTVDVPFPMNGQWQELLNEQTLTVDNYWIRGQVVESNWGKIFFRLA
jgi:1,4-alpha-glucan branching enzyme